MTILCLLHGYIFSLLWANGERKKLQVKGFVFLTIIIFFFYYPCCLSFRIPQTGGVLCIGHPPAWGEAGLRTTMRTDDQRADDMLLTSQKSKHFFVTSYSELYFGILFRVHVPKFKYMLSMSLHSALPIIIRNNYSLLYFTTF